jgi:hypothetical protein
MKIKYIIIFSETSYSSLIRGPVVTVGSVGVEGAEVGEERKLLELDAIIYYPYFVLVT